MIDSSRSNPIPWSSQLFEWMLLLTQEVSTNWCSWKCPQTNSKVPWFCFDHWFFKKCFQTAFWKKKPSSILILIFFAHKWAAANQENRVVYLKRVSVFISVECRMECWHETLREDWKALTRWVQTDGTLKIYHFCCLWWRQLCGGFLLCTHRYEAHGAHSAYTSVMSVWLCMHVYCNNGASYSSFGLVVFLSVLDWLSSV